MPSKLDELSNVSQSALKALASSVLVPQAQSVLADLLERNADGKLSESESEKLDELIEQIDELNLLKARAEYTLRRQAVKGDS